VLCDIIKINDNPGISPLPCCGAGAAQLDYITQHPLNLKVLVSLERLIK
jgi:hypothetical protein